jgi:hypothetical protein
MMVSYAPGEAVPQPGVYAVLHGKPHDFYHELYIQGGNFPPCSICTGLVRFRLIRAVTPIERHEDFKRGVQAA